MIADHLYSFLSTQSGITTLVSTRIYPVILPQEPTYPCITYREDSNDWDETFGGQEGMVDSYYNIDAWAKTFAEVTSIGNAIRSAMQNTVGSFGGINIHKCVVDTGPITVYEDSVEAYRQTHVFLISHNEG
jgi:hypothetical protein